MYGGAGVYWALYDLGESVSTVDWYNTSAWRKRRQGQLTSHPLCWMCQQMGYVTPATVADHVVPHRGDRELFWRGELASLCKYHHDSTKQAEEIRGYSIAIGEDGMPVDSRHPARAYTRGD